MKEKKFIIANWKMKLEPAEAIQQAAELKKLVNQEKIDSNIQIVVAPDFLSWQAVAQVLRGSRIALGAQDGWYEDKGAFTGEVSLAILKKIGCQYVILGHSERRQHLHEVGEIINRKIATALRVGLIPILCVGETFDDRKDGRKEVVIIQQVQAALKNVDLQPQQKLIVAYEPVWVIGSGQAIDPAEAAHTAMTIKQSLIDVLENQDLPLVEIIYGGSVEPDNIKDFMNLPEIKGALVGGASLEAKTFIQLIKQI